MVSGDLSLVNDIGRVQLAIQSAIRTSVNLDAVQNFKTRENIALKSKLSTSDVDFKLGKMTAVEYDRVKHETLLALQKLGEVMSPIDQEFLVQKQRGSTTFAVASNEDSDVGQRVVDLAAGRI